MTNASGCIPNEASDEMTAAIRQVWDLAADSYGYGNLDATEPQRQAWMALLSRLFPPTESLRIVDVGCGPGFITLSLAELGHRVIGIDLSPEMLKLCQQSADARGLADVQLVLGSAEAPPADIASVDAVISRHLLWTLPRPETAVAAWAGLTKPGGRVLSLDSLWSSELIRETEGSDYPLDVRRLLPLLYARDLEPVRNVWRRAGLTDVMAEELTWLDEVIRAEVSMERRAMHRSLTLFLVEGRRVGHAEDQ